MKINIKIKNDQIICEVELVESTPLYKHPGNTGRLIDYENFEKIKLAQVQERAQESLGSKGIIESCESGPWMIHNKDNSNRSATWVFKIKSLTSNKKSGNVTKQASSTKRKKTTTKSHK